jgi:crossover junction endodeoxyribonuclease RuvC
VRLIGVDPGSHKTGWGIIEVAGNKVTHVDNGVLFLDDDRSLTIRLVDLCQRLRDVLVRYQPDAAAVEDVFVQRGARSALILGQARGAALATLGLHGLRVTSIPTSQVKLRVAGRGRADKDQVAEMVRALLSLPEVPFEDAADALAVAISVAFETERALTVVGEVAAKPAERKPARKGRDALLALARAQGKA